jgi:hypothetical protein
MVLAPYKTGLMHSMIFQSRLVQLLFKNQSINSSKQVKDAKMKNSSGLNAWLVMRLVQKRWIQIMEMERMMPNQLCLIRI